MIYSPNLRYGSIGKWSIHIESNNKVRFYDNTTYHAFYVPYQMIPAGALLDTVEIVNSRIPKSALNKARSMLKKYHKSI